MNFLLSKGYRGRCFGNSLNLNMVRFKRISESADTRIIVPIKGKTKFKARIFLKQTASFEILNPELMICNLDD